MTDLPDYIVWRMDETEEALCAQLEHPEFFAEKIEPLKPGSRRRHEVLAVRCAMKVLFEGTELPVLYTADGAPYLPENTFQGKPCFISISHTQGFAMAIRSEVPVGADIERRGDRVQRVVSHFLRPEELTTLQLAGGDVQVALHLAWSAKEAAFKVLGKAYYDLQQLTTVLFIDWDTQLLCLAVQGRKKPLQIHFDVHPEYVLTWVQLITEA